MMHRLLLATVATISLVLAAGDVTPARAAPPVPYSWTGFYVGGNFGGGWGNTGYSGGQSTASTSFLTSLAARIAVAAPVGTFAGSEKSSGIFGGGQIGYNYQFPSTPWLVGVEADIDASSIRGSSSYCPVATSTGPGPGTGSTFVLGCSTNSMKLEDFGTVRGRLGYAWDNLLFYGTGGWAWARSSSTLTNTCMGSLCPGHTSPFTSSAPSVTSTLGGWAAGGGFEWAFLPHWAFRVEYLHLQFNGVGTNYAFSGANNIITPFSTIMIPFTGSAHLSSNSGFDLVRVGLDYTF